MTTQGLFTKALLLATTTATALAVALGITAKKADAAPQDMRMAPNAMMNRPPVPMEIIQPRFVNPTAVNLLNIAHMALQDPAFAEQVWRDPEGVARRYHLSRAEFAVLRHMDRETFDVARGDAGHLVAVRVNARMMQMPPGATDARLITERMIVGRAILAAAGRSYLDAADAHACCPWSKAIELGLSGDPAYYNQVFVRRAGMMGGQQ